MSRPVDGLIATIDQIRPVLQATICGDAYQIRRDVPTDDGYGGLTPKPRTVEAGWCKLTIMHRRLGNETTNPNTVISTALSTCALPSDTGLLATDTLIVNDRAYRVTDIKRPGVLGLFADAQLDAIEGEQ